MHVLHFEGVSLKYCGLDTTNKKIMLKLERDKIRELWTSKIMCHKSVLWMMWSGKHTWFDIKCCGKNQTWYRDIMFQIWE